MTNIAEHNPTAAQRWLARYARLTAVVVFCMLLSGGTVTSYEVGMAVPDWPTTFGQNMVLFPWLQESLGVQIEHGHRLLGMIVGLLAIGMAVFVWLADNRRWTRWLAVAVLALIVLQGILGGQRVVFNRMGIGRELALFHGIAAQVCFAMLAATATVLSPRWRTAARVAHPLAEQVRRLSAAAVGVVFAQVVLGAVQRHLRSALVLHLGLAAAWLLMLLYVAVVILLDEQLRHALGGTVGALLGLTVAQAFLGVGAIWATGLMPRGMGAAPTHLQAMIPTLHLGAGALIFALAVVQALWSIRLVELAPCPIGNVERGVARREALA